MREQGITPQLVEEWKTIRIPKEDQVSYDGPVTQDFVTEVQPLDDAWLLDTARTPEEIDYVLEGRLQEIQLSLQNPDQSPIAQKYGITRQVQVPTERMIAYAELIGEYSFLKNSHEHKNEELRENLDSEKAAVKSKVQRRELKKGKGQQEINNLAKNYSAKMATHRDGAQDAERVQSLIHRKFALEYFSLRDHEEVTASLFVSTLNHLTEIPQQQPEGIESIGNMIDGVSQFLSKTQDGTFMRSFRYKTGEGLTSTYQDLQTLRVFQDMYLNPEHFVGDEAMQHRLHGLAHSFFSFLKNQAKRLSQQSLPGDNPYPNLTLLYDMANTCINSGELSLLSRSNALFEREFNDYANAPLIDREIKKLVDNYLQTVHQRSATSFQNLMEQGSVAVSEFNQWTASPEVRLLYGLKIFSGKRQPDNQFYTPNRLFRQLGGKIIHEEYRRGKQSSPEAITEKVVFESFVNQYLTDRNLYPSLGIQADISDSPFVDMLGRIEDDIVSAQLAQERKTKLQQVWRQMKKDSQNRYDHVQQEYFFQFWLDEFLGDSNEQLLQQFEEENRFLQTEVQNGLKWFVSPRGDRYQEKDDPFLSQKAINNLTFRIDRQFPQEYIIETKIEGIEQPFQFWLDRSGQLLDRNRGVLRVNNPASIAFKNAVLKRLYYITSGLLSKDPTEEQNGDGDSLNLEYRRAHYTILNSTSTRPITMTSHGALIHAQEVLEQYGIDIFAEIARRRRIGRLFPHQYLTFTREVTPEIQARNILPNIIKFDPTAIEFPAQSAPSSEQ